MCVGNIFANFFYHEKQQIISRFFPAAVSFFLCFRCEPKRNAAPRAGKQFSSMTAERLSLIYLPARDKTSKKYTGFVAENTTATQRVSGDHNHVIGQLDCLIGSL